MKVSLDSKMEKTPFSLGETVGQPGSSAALPGSLPAVGHSASSTACRCSTHGQDGSLVFREVWQNVRCACWGHLSLLPLPGHRLGHHPTSNQQTTIQALSVGDVKFPPFLV